MSSRTRTHRLFLITLAVLALLAPLSARADYSLDFNSDHWEGVLYCQNVYQGLWLPTMTGQCADLATSDTCWGMMRTRFTIPRDYGTQVFQVLPRLSSGGPHTDEAHIGFGDGYSHYVGQFVGVTLSAGTIYLGTSADYHQVAIGAYTPGVTLLIRLFVDADGWLTVSGDASGSIDTNGILPERFRILLDVADSEDGIEFCDLVVPTENTTWGALKKDYR